MEDNIWRSGGKWNTAVELLKHHKLARKGNPEKIVTMVCRFESYLLHILKFKTLKP